MGHHGLSRSCLCSSRLAFIFLCSIHSYLSVSVDVVICLDLGSIPGLGRCPGEGNGYPLQRSGLEDPMDCIVQGVAESWTQLSDFHVDVDALRRSGGDSVRKSLNCVSTFGNKPVNSLIFIHYFSPSVPVCLSLSHTHTQNAHFKESFTYSKLLKVLNALFSFLFRIKFMFNLFHENNGNVHQGTEQWKFCSSFLSTQSKSCMF